MRPDSIAKVNASLVLAITLVGVIAAGFFMWWLPRERVQRIAKNERSASSAILSLAQAEADFRANDRDWNGILDFWTGDVAGLYSVISQGNGLAIHLIPRELAEADAAPLKPLVPAPVPYHGYLFVAMDWDDTGEKPEALKQKTDASGAVHHKEKCAWCAYPSVPGETGKRTYFVSINIDRPALYGTYNQGLPVLRWPKGGANSAGWAIID